MARIGFGAVWGPSADIIPPRPPQQQDRAQTLSQTLSPPTARRFDPPFAASFSGPFAIQRGFAIPRGDGFRIGAFAPTLVRRDHGQISRAPLARAFAGGSDHLPTAAAALLPVSAPHVTAQDGAAGQSPIRSPITAEKAAGDKGPPHTAAKKWQIYGFSFWRLAGRDPGGLAPAAQYGGSQSGIIGTYRIGGGENSDLSALARINITPQNSGDRELAAGISWQPRRKIPVRLIAEYRARAPAPDAAAAYITAALPDILLPGDFRLSGFGQSGFVHNIRGGAAGRTAFLDAGLRAERGVAGGGRLGLAVGAGAWAGGQSGSRRLDIGPAATLDIQIAGQKARLNADWRFRIGGNASPGNGPALTLSTGF